MRLTKCCFYNEIICIKKIVLIINLRLRFSLKTTNKIICCALFGNLLMDLILKYLIIYANFESKTDKDRS